MSSEDLDRKSERILEALYNHGGEAETGEIKEYTGIEKNGVVHYRINEKLEPAGLVETRTVDDGDRRLGVKITSLTDEGKRAVERVLDEGDGPSLVEKMDYLEADFEALREEVRNQQGRVEDAVEDVAEVEEVAREAEAAIERVEVLADHVEELRRRVDHVEDHPFEDVVEAKIAELRQVAASVEDADAKNADVRRALRSHGVIQATRKPLSRSDVPESQYEWLNKQKNNPTRNTPLRDAYEAGPAIEAVSEEVPKPTGDGAAVPASTAEKLTRLDSAGLLDGMLDAIEDHGVEETAEALAEAGGGSE